MLNNMLRFTVVMSFENSLAFSFRLIPTGSLLIFTLLSIYNLTAFADNADDIFRNARFTLEEANNFEKIARNNLLKGNQLRQQLLELRRNPDQSSQQNNQNLRAVAQEASMLQQQGSILRAQGITEKDMAIDLFASAMATKWPQTVSNLAPFIAELNTSPPNKIQTTNHNTVERSVHPRLGQEQLSAEAPQLINSSSMTLTPTTNAQKNQVQNIDRRRVQISRDQKLLAHIGLYQNDTNLIPLNKIHQWNLVLSNLKGELISNARITFSGHMPGHVHGLPTQPLINEELSPGVYAVSGVKFQMPGWWIIDFHIETEDGEDQIRFNLAL